MRSEDTGQGRSALRAGTLPEGERSTIAEAADTAAPQRIQLSSEARERFAAQLGQPDLRRSGPDEQTLAEATAPRLTVRPSAFRLATAASGRELAKTLSELRQQATPTRSGDDGNAAVDRAVSSAQPGKLTQFWENRPERADPVQESKRAAVLKLLGALRREWLVAAAESGQLRFRTLQRDDQLALSEHVIFVHSGQLALGLFSQRTLANEQEFQELKQSRGYEGPEEIFQRGLRLGPMARAAALNVALLHEGDAIGPREPLRRLRASLPPEHHLVLYAVTPAVVCIVDRSLIADWCRLDLDFQQRLDATMQAATGPLRGSSVLLDHYLRHGGSLAQTLRVVDPERCALCRECERACAERHGHARLRIKGPTVGGLSLVETCQSCADPRCVAACGFAALRYDADKREVVLDEDRCVGCSYCETACPYGAIDLIDLAAAPRFVAKMSARIALAKSARPPGASETERHPLFENRRRVASKCDHCAGFSDQACISACGKDALYEIKPLALYFRPAPDARPGSRADLRPLAELASATSLKLTERAEQRPSPAVREPGQLIWRCTLLVVAAFYSGALLQRGRISHSSGLGLGAGVLGWLLLLLTWGFAACSRVPAVREAAARGSAWSPLRLLGSCDLHAAVGLSGPLLILLHARLVPTTRDAPAFFGYLFMGGALLAGLLLRYLPRWIHRRLGQAQASSERLLRELPQAVPSEDEQRAARAVLLSCSDRLRARVERPDAASSGHRLSSGRALLALGRYLLGATFGLGATRALQRALSPPHASRAAVKWTREALCAQAAQILLSPALGLVNVCKYLHITSAVFLLVLALIHVLHCARGLW